MNDLIQASSVPEKQRRFGSLQVFLFVLVAVLITAAGTIWIVKTYVFPSEFKPVQLSAGEERVLDAKLKRLDPLSAAPEDTASAEPGPTADAPEFDDEGRLIAERYSEEGASREVGLSERELNALLAKNTTLAKKLAIDLSDNLVSAKLLLPVDEDFPFLGGQILKVRAGLELAYEQGRPIVVLRGISIMGVPLPNAWLGGIKNIDLVKEYGAEGGFWHGFSEGVEQLRVEEGTLRIKLKE